MNLIEAVKHTRISGDWIKRADRDSDFDNSTCWSDNMMDHPQFSYEDVLCNDWIAIKDEVEVYNFTNAVYHAEDQKRKIKRLSWSNRDSISLKSMLTVSIEDIFAEDWVITEREEIK